MQTRTNAIQQGWDVYGSDDQKIGSVDQVASNYVVIQKGWFFTSDVYIPTQAIESVDAVEGRVYLNIAKGDVDAQGWTNPPEDGQYESDQSQEWEGWAARGDRQTTDRESGTMALHAEELQAQKTTEEVGSVNLRKDVVEEQKTIDVPVTREEVHVRRTPVDRPADTETAFQSDQIDVPVRADRVEVDEDAARRRRGRGLQDAGRGDEDRFGHRPPGAGRCGNDGRCPARAVDDRQRRDSLAERRPGLGSGPGRRAHRRRPGLEIPMATTRRTAQKDEVASATQLDELGTERLLLHEERAQVTTTPEVVGHVRIRKDVENDERTFDVDVTTTEVATTRRRVDRPAGENFGPYQEGDTLVIPVIEERLQLRKVPYVVEEILVRQTPKRETRSVTETVRREVVKVETVGDVEEAK